MTTSLTNRAAMPCQRAQSVRRVLGFGMACGGLAMLLLTGGTPAALAQSLTQPTANRVFAGCKLETSSTGSRINTVAGLQNDIKNSASGSVKIPNPVVAYIVVYAIDNDNNGQALQQGSSSVGFSGPVICINPNATGSIARALQTNDISNIDILDVQDALILRHTPTGAAAAQPDANRICHTTDGFTDCFDIK